MAVAATPRAGTWPRLQRLERLHDGFSIQELSVTGVGANWDCLEVGAGGGSIARWLLERVSLTGSVTALDLQTTYLGDLVERAGATVIEANVVDVEFSASSFDLIHTPDYLQWITAHSELFDSAPLDRLATIVASSLTDGPKGFYTVLTATAANGRMGDAVAFGIKAQQFVSDTLGLPTAFLVPVYGPFGAVVWLTGADSMTQLDTAVEMQMTNTDYHA